MQGKPRPSQRFSLPTFLGFYAGVAWGGYLGYHQPGGVRGAIVGALFGAVLTMMVVSMLFPRATISQYGRLALQALIMRVFIFDALAAAVVFAAWKYSSLKLHVPPIPALAVVAFINLIAIVRYLQLRSGRI